MNYFNSYEPFTDGEIIKPIPGITIPVMATDKRITYKKIINRFDKLSQSYYQTPYYGFLIMAANPQYGGLEFNIPNNTVIRIPYPFEVAIKNYLNEAKKHINQYGK